MNELEKEQEREEWDKLSKRCQALLAIGKGKMPQKPITSEDMADLKGEGE